MHYFTMKEKYWKLEVVPKHNAAIVRPYNTDTTEIWTWGQGWFGRLGHGSERFQLKPKLILSIRRMNYFNLILLFI